LRGNDIAGDKIALTDRGFWRGSAQIENGSINIATLGIRDRHGALRVVDRLTTGRILERTGRQAEVNTLSSWAWSFGNLLEVNMRENRSAT
jgi:hypothetical protein